MNVLQRVLEEVLQEAPYQAFAELIAAKLEAQGLKLSARDRLELTQELRSGTDGNFRLRRWQWWEKQDVTVEITDEDFERFEKDFSEFLDEGLPDFIDETSEELATESLSTLKKRWSSERRRQDRDLADLRRSLERHWDDSIELLRLLVTIARELGDVVIDARGELDHGSQLVDVQRRLHARACQVADEIICLLKAGFADGAMARWRTLHEITVVALLLSQHGDALAERFVAHDAVESWKAAQQYQNHSEKLGCEDISAHDMMELEQDYRQVVARYGSAFKEQYGWAAELIGRSKPSFAALELASGIEHMRPYYRFASHQVHSNPKGTFFRVGLMDDVDIILSGPSDFGLSDPGQNTAISLMQVVVSILTSAPTLDGVVGAKMLMALSREVCDSFVEARSRFDEAEI